MQKKCSIAPIFCDVQFICLKHSETCSHSTIILRKIVILDILFWTGHEQISSYSSTTSRQLGVVNVASDMDSQPEVLRITSRTSIKSSLNRLPYELSCLTTVRALSTLLKYRSGLVISIGRHWLLMPKSSVSIPGGWASRFKPEPKSRRIQQ